MPCNEQHPCCARQGPTNPSSLPAASKNSRADSQDVAPVVAHEKFKLPLRIAMADCRGSSRRSYFERSTVLRI